MTKVNKNVSMKDIAQQAGVSTALVSYVLSGKEKEGRVGLEMAKKIRQIADELHYKPNYVAKSLRSGRTQSIGLILADISNPFFANIARIVEDEAKRNGYTLIIGSSDEDAGKSWDLIQALLHRQVDGFILISSEQSEEQIHYLNHNQIPFVLLDRHFPAIPTDFVALDNHAAAYQAGLHLLEGGYRNIGMIAYRSQLFHMHERIRGYRDALQANHVPFHPDWLTEVDFTQIDAQLRVGIDTMLAAAQPVDALIFTTYRLAISGLKYINELGLRVPDDLAIVSFGQAEAFDLYYCPITYIQQPMEELGKLAVKTLVTKLNQSEEAMNQVLLHAKLIVRDSSRPKLTHY